MTNEILDQTEDNLDDLGVQLIRKYAVLLSILLIVDLLINVSNVIIMTRDLFNLNLVEERLFNLVYYLPTYLSGIITALFVYQDMKKTNTVSPAIIILTIVYNEIGACFFLIRVLYIALLRRIDKNQKA